ncbi:hypothetical protein BR93DRAFT_981643 [Coniochaeta sp. PMI_546]|nr:hypothetical protein BR93DRAFT_981643 [Coniochaeta sp. PMI_546]
MAVVPNWLRIALLLLSFASFQPQLRLLWMRRDSSGISLYYVLCNLIVATELFTISFFYVVNNRVEGSQFFVHNPPNVGDSIDLAQFALIWVLWLLLFTACLAYPSDRDRDSRTTVSAIYVSFLLISLVPLFVDAALDDPADQYHKWGLAFFSGAHIFLVNFIVTMLGFAAPYIQAQTIIARPPGSGPGALSLVGLAAQAVIFALLAPTWLGRLVFPWEELGAGLVNWNVLKTWYQLVGFVALDHAVFAIVQAFLLWLAVRHGRDGSPPGVPAGETAPLLGS